MIESTGEGDLKRLQKMLDGHHPCILVNTFEEVYTRELVVEAAVNLQMEMWVWTVTEGVRNALISDSESIPQTENPAAGMLYLSHQKGQFIALALDLLEHLREPRVLRVIRDLIYQYERLGSTLIIVDHRNELPKSLQFYTTRFDISLPDEEELEDIVRRTLRTFHQKTPIEIDIGRKGLKTILRNLRGLTRRQVKQIIIATISDDRRFDRNDINSVIVMKRQMLQADGLLEYIEIPTDLNEIGGLKRLKRWLQMRQDALTDEAAEFGIDTPRGVLMLGVQGAGKSLCAKAIATAWHRPLLRMDTGALYDRYIGESERRLRMSLRQAEMMAPVVLWIDEIEKAFASAASRNIDGGLSQRMFGTLLTWMQEHQESVFLVATANDIEALPPELLRKGRFDEIFFVDLPKLETRKEIVAIHLQKRKRNPNDFDLDAIARQADGFSGAEIEQAIVSGLHEAFSRNIELDTKIILDMIQSSPPLSVTMAEKITNLQRWAIGRCLPAD
ncbi:MAG: AAA family ATPase [Sedimentisphaerales bacterium]|nr:AAA family ATPase [Sedimentisphaerales bacterium]